MNRTAKYLSIAGAALTLLAGCSNAKETLGLTRSSPDEFAVVKRAPLEMPPDYSLRPPMPGAPRPQEQAPDSQAREAVFGRDEAPQAARAPGSAESILLQQTGATEADPRIRNVVDRENANIDKSKKPVAERLLGWAGAGDDEPPATVVDPAAETERLRRNQEQGKPVTAGETPSHED